MYNHNQLLYSKRICWFILISSLLFINCPSVMAITPVNKHAKKLTASKNNRQTKEPIYLLHWQGNRISTTAGVFITGDEITIIDENNVKDSFSAKPQRQTNSHKLHHVILKKDGRRLVQITIK